MTSGFVEHHPVDASPASLRRTLDVTRRAMRAVDAHIIAPQGSELSGAFEDDSVLSAAVSPNGEPVAQLVVRDKPGRSWSDDDGAILRDLAAGLAEEIRLTDLVARLEAGRNGSPSSFDDAGDAVAVPTNSAGDAMDEQHDAVASDGEGQQAGALRILLADDLDLNRKLISDMLSLDGYVVDSVADGAAAVDAVKANSYDLVLMDMIMPGMDGMDATRAIRALPAPACDVPIVALTAHSFREQLDNCLHAGMNATLTKPMSFDALSGAVVTWARRQAA